MRLASARTPRHVSPINSFYVSGAHWLATATISWWAPAISSQISANEKQCPTSAICIELQAVAYAENFRGEGQTIGVARGGPKRPYLPPNV